MSLTDKVYEMDNRAHAHPGPGLKETLHPLTVDFIAHTCPSDDDPVVNGYVMKYKLNDPDIYTCIFDKDSTYFINSYVLAQMAERIGKIKNLDKINLVVIVTGTGYCRLDEKVFNPDKISLSVTPSLNWELAVKLMSISVNHILTRSKLSNICSKLPFPVSLASPLNRYILVPMPSIDNTQHVTGSFSISVPMESTVFFDRIYYINLDKHEDRRRDMESQLLALNLGATRVSAIDGATLPWNSEYHGSESATWNKGALGYSVSYASAIADALQTNSNRILILSDKAVLAPNTLLCLEKAFADLPDDWHMFYLSTDEQLTEADRVGESLYRMKGSVDSHAIIINRPAFETILNFASAPYGPLGTYFSVYQQICSCYSGGPRFP